LHSEKIKTDMKITMKHLSIFVMAALALAGCSDDSGNKKVAADSIQANNDGDQSERATRELDPNREQREKQRPAGPTTSIKFDKYEHNFGNIKEGDVVETVFKFTNTGNEPLIIESAQGSCGCTVPEYPKEPIPPGGSGDMKVKFNSQAKVNLQRKNVVVTTNTVPEKTTLTIVADVEPMPRPDGSVAPRQ
jgi:hypothetical protein